MTTNRKRHRNRRARPVSRPLTLNQDETLVLTCDGPLSLKGIPGQEVIARGVAALDWQRDGQQVHVHADGPLTMEAPQSARLALEADGPINVKELIESDIEVLSLDGSLRISGGASVRISKADGPVNVAEIQGDVWVQELDGPSFFKNIGGDITITQADGPINVKNCRGDVDVSNEGGAFLRLAGDQSQNVRIRSDDNIYLKLPVTACIEGVIRADESITIELDQQSVRKPGATVTLTPPAGVDPIISVAIESNGEVYIGPNPPIPVSGSAFHQIGLGWLGRIFGGRKPSGSGDAAPPPFEPASTGEDSNEEQEMILRMVAEGKITAAEGDQLLEALQ